MTLYFEPWQLVAVCLLTIIGAAVVAIVLVGLLGAWLFRDRGSVPVARTVADEEAEGFRDDCVYCRSLRARWDSGVNIERHAAYHRTLDEWAPRPSSTVRLHAVHDRDACDACAGRDRGSF
jgi:hypothetical protein